MEAIFMKTNSAKKLLATIVATALLISLPNSVAYSTTSSYDLNYEKLVFLPEADLTRSNAELKVGFQRRYNNVVTIDGQAIDAVISIVSVTGHRDNEIDTFDEYDNSDQISFHTQVDGTSTSQAAVRLRYQFLRGGTDTAVVLKNIRISVADIDSWEFVHFYNVSSYKLSSPTNLSLQASTLHPDVLFLSSADGTSNTDQTRIAEVNYDAVSSFDVRAGCRHSAVNKVGVNGKCGFILTMGTVLLTGATTSVSITQTPYTITYAANGSTAGTAPTSTSGTGIQTISENNNGLVKGSEVFVGWNTKADGTGLQIDPGADFVPDANITLYAQYAAPSVASYTVIFDANDPSNSTTGSMANQTSAVTADLTLENFTREGYEFLGWNTKADGSGTPYVDGDTYSFTANMTLYAQWKQIPTVTFIANGGTGTMADQTSAVTTDLTPENFTRDGYEFAGWNTAADGSGELYADEASYPFTENLTLYAVWAAVAIPPTPYTVTFHANDPSNSTEGTMSPQTSAEPISLTAVSFSRAGYEFVGWNTAISGRGISYSDKATYVFRAHLALYANWQPIEESPETGVSLLAEELPETGVPLSAQDLVRTGVSIQALLLISLSSVLSAAGFALIMLRRHQRIRHYW